jgi:hypothetical protein
MKKITYTIATSLTITAIILAQSAMHVSANYTLGGQKLLNQASKMENHTQNQASRSATRQANQLQNIINRANSLINSRLSSLNTLSTRVQNDTRLSSDEKTSLTTGIQTDISGLTALKTKIDADTDVTTARTDEKTIITSYYIYAVFVPKIRLLITLNNLQTTTAYIEALSTQLQTLITTLQSQGKSVTQLTPLITDISTQVQTINTTVTADITAVEGVSTTSNTGASATFQKVRQDISQIVKAGFAKIRSDFSQMRSIFKQIILPGSLTPTVNPTGATVTTAPTAAASIAPTTVISTSPSPTQ